MNAAAGHLKREIGLVGLTFIGVGGILGSGWLFAPMLAAKATGASAIIAWPIGALFMMLLALTFAEVSSMVPATGGLATVPLLSHGRTYSMIVGWSAWIGYGIAAPIEVELVLRYMEPIFPWLYAKQGQGGLTLWGTLIAFACLGMLVGLNALGVAFFARINSAITWIKILIPLLVSAVLIGTQFSTSNLTTHGGFMPYGVEGVLAAISTGGVVLSYLGFRHIIDLAGEAKRPRTTIPLALVLTLLICMVIYIAIQVAFIGALTPTELDEGWAKLHFHGDFGPLGAIAAGVGIMWLVSLLNVSAVISPFGGAFIQVGGNARLVLAMAYNGFFPRLFEKLSSLGVPMRAHFLNFAVGCAVFATLSLAEMAAIVSALLVFSFVAGPIAVGAMRRLAPDMPRGFRMPTRDALALVALCVATVTIYWSGWNTVKLLMLAVVVGAPLVAYRAIRAPAGERDFRNVLWLVPYLAGVGLLAYFGRFNGGTKDLPHGVDLALALLLSAGAYCLAMATRLGAGRFAAVLAEVEAEMNEEDGADG